MVPPQVGAQCHVAALVTLPSANLCDRMQLRTPVTLDFRDVLFSLAFVICDASPLRLTSAYSVFYAGPVLLSDIKQLKQWTFNVKGHAPDGSDLVTIHTYYPSQGNMAPRCQGYMVPEKPAACNSPQHLASKVHIHPEGQDTVWTITKVNKGAYTIATTSRGDGCLKYLGGDSNCSNLYTQLYARDDGSGQQWWVITPVESSAQPADPIPVPSPHTSSPPPSPSPSPTATASPSPIPSPSPSPVASLPVSPSSPPSRGIGSSFGSPIPQANSPLSPPPSLDIPGAPLSVEASATSDTAATVEWTAPAPAGTTPIIGYSVKCTTTGGAQTSVGPQRVLAPATTTGTGGFVGLSPNTQYTCTVVPFNTNGPGPASTSLPFTTRSVPASANVLLLWHKYACT